MRRIPGSLALPAALAGVLALLGATGIGPPLARDRGGVVVVVDVSPSCDAPERLPAGALRFDDSDLGAALRRAAAVPGARRVRIVTDAVDARGGEPAVPALPVDVELRPRRDDVDLLALRAPPRVPRGVDFAVEIVVGRTAGPPRPGIDVAVELLRDGKRVGGEPLRVRLGRGESRRLLVRDRVEEEGLVRYRALLGPGPGDRADDRLETAVHVGGRPLLLAVGAPGVWPGFDVQATDAAAVGAVLAGAEARARVDVVLVAGDVPLPGAQEALARAVREGAGLVVLGGRGFAGRPLGSVLPLTDAPPGGRAALLLLDCSGSMAEHKETLLAGVERLKGLLAPDDRIAFLAFRGEVIAGAPWSAVRDARWDLRSIAARGSTRLGPAVSEATVRLAELAQAQRRLFVVSDGEWADAREGALADGLASLAAEGVHLAAVFVKDPAAEDARARFPVHVLAGGDLAGALVRLEEEAPDRRVEGPVRAERAAAPAWLEDAVPPAGEYRRIERLYARGLGESVALHAGGIPVLGAWRPAGRVAVVAADLASNPPLRDRLPALLRACARPAAGARLEASRDRGALVLEARGEAGGTFRVNGVAVAASPAGPGRWRARVEHPPGGDLEVGFADALVVVPAGAAELQGLHGRPDVAASIARRTGGRLLAEGEGCTEAPSRPAPHATLLVAAGLVVLGALLRRGA